MTDKFISFFYDSRTHLTHSLQIRANQEADEYLRVKETKPASLINKIYNWTVTIYFYRNDAYPGSRFLLIKLPRPYKNNFILKKSIRNIRINMISVLEYFIY